MKEWICHLIDAQPVLIGRFEQFERYDDPLIADYEPPPPSDTRYRDRDFGEAMSAFAKIRAETVNQLQGYDASFWARSGRHESYSPYGTRILLSHMLNVDYAHLFGIESAGLSSEAQG